MRGAPLLFSLFLAATTFGQSIVTPLFVHKDGEASVSGYAGSEKDILVDGGSEPVTGWITFQTEGVDLSQVSGAMLSLYVKSVDALGTMRVYPLDGAVTAPENNLALGDISMATDSVASVSLSSADVEQVVQLDISAALSGGSFYGVALVSDDGLLASFDAKEGHLAPVVLLTHDVESAAARWHSGATAPDAGLGKDGDYYLNTATGDVSARSGGAWSVSLNIVGDTGPRGVQGPAGPEGSFPSGKAAGDMQYWDGTQWVMIPAGRTGQALNLSSSGVPEWTDRPGTVTDIDGNSYRTIVIGNQEWTVTNLRTTHYRDGTPIPFISNGTTWAGLTSGACCVYPELAADVESYGLLYNWYAVSDSRGLAPEGWRVPDTTDWNTLENYLIANGYNYDGTTTGNKIAKSMAAGVWTTSATTGAVGNGLSTNNKSGFSALPGGYRYGSGSFSGQGGYGRWWSATEGAAAHAYARYLGYDDEGLNRSANGKKYGFSVRLVRNLD